MDDSIDEEFIELKINEKNTVVNSSNINQIIKDEKVDIASQELFSGKNKL
jgi:hypothetical protein